MRIVIAGGGRLGSQLAEKLVDEHHEVTVIDRDPEVCAVILEEIGAVTVRGDATDRRVLVQAGVAAADVVVGLLSRDADTVAFALLARGMSRARIMVRMLDESYQDAYRQAGVEDIVSAASIVVERVSSTIEFPRLRGSLPLGHAGAMLVEVEIPRGASVIGTTIASLRLDQRLPKECVFVGLVDLHGRFELASGTSTIEPDQIVLAVTRRADIAQLVSVLTAGPTPPRSADPAMSIVDALRRSDLFRLFEDEELAAVLRGVERRALRDGDVVFRRGEPADRLYVLSRGAVALTPAEGEPYRVVPHAVLGDLELLVGAAHRSTARALGDTELLALPRDVLQRAVMGSPRLAHAIDRELGERLARVAEAAGNDERG